MKSPQKIRIATFNVALDRDKPGQLAAELAKGLPQARNIAHILQLIRPDIVLLNEFDHEGAAAETPAAETPATGAAVGPAAGGHPVANAPEAAPAETPATTQTAPQGNEAKNVARGGLVRGAPQDLVNQAFEIAAPGDVEVVDTEGRVFLVTLEKVTAATTDGADAQIVRQGVESRLSDAMRQDLLNYYTRAIQTDRKATINQTAIDAVNARVQ